MSKVNRHLKMKGGYWHYQRRVPKRYAIYDDRHVVQCSLRTQSVEVARLRRDAVEESDNRFWASLAGSGDETDSVAAMKRQHDVAKRKYDAAIVRALARGFVYEPAERLAETATLDELMERIDAIKQVDTTKPNAVLESEATALLGGQDLPPVTVSAAFEIYCSDIAADELVGKSKAQIAAWKKTKKRGIQYFIDVVSDKPMREITRQDALQYYNWWKDRVVPKEGETAPKKLLSTKTANRDLGNMRKLFGEYFKHIGDEDRANPFRNLSFKDKAQNPTPPFSSRWVREKILVPTALDGIPGEGDLLIFALIETGCRPGEIANLLTEDIHLDKDVPYISIRPKKGREIKTRSSIRDIPLIGVSLEAMKRAPNGFPFYRDKPNLLSANLMKNFRSRSLFPTPEHQIYSFRHSFEKRMQEAELDYGFRCMIMGHRNTRPKYGDGGSMEYRRDQLLKIAHPYSNDLFAPFL